MNPFQHVLAGIDMHPNTAEAVLGRACELAEPDAIEAVYACSYAYYEHNDYTVGGFEAADVLDVALREQADQYLASVCASRGITRHRVLDGATAPALHTYAKQRSDLVVVGHHGHYGLRALFASTSNAMIHGTPCDVLAVHLDETVPSEPPPYTKILAAVDLGDESFQVMDAADRVALHCGAELAVCNVMHGWRGTAREDTGWRCATEEDAPEDRLAHLADCYGVAEHDVFELSGHVAERIRALAAEIGAGLVVVGTHGKHGLQLLTGSMANAVLRGSGYDLLAARVH